MVFLSSYDNPLAPNYFDHYPSHDYDGDDFQGSLLYTLLGFMP